MSKKKKSILYFQIILLIWLTLVTFFFQEQYTSCQISQGSFSFPLPTSIDKTFIKGRWTPSYNWLVSCSKNIESNKSGMLLPFQSLRVGYALGDCMKMCYRCKINEKTLIRENSKSGVLAKHQVLGPWYYNLACPLGNDNYQSGGNLSLIKNILEKFEVENVNTPKRISIPDDNSIVLHLRLGDVIENANLSPVEMLFKGGNPAHSEQWNSAIKSVSEYIKNIESANTNRVYIVGGGYGNSADYRKSRVYAECLQQALKYAGYNVSMNLDSGDADADFYFMTHAKKFVPTTGGYSTLIGRMVRFYGGDLVGSTFEDMDVIKWYETIYETVKENELNLLS